MTERRRVVWLTNHLAPYRSPVWAHMALTVDLRVLTESSPDRAVADSRSTDWISLAAPGVEVERLPVRQFSVRGAALPTLTSALGPWVDDADALLLGGWQSPVYWQFLVAAKRRHIRTVGFTESTKASHGHRSGPIAKARARFFNSLDAVVTPGGAASESVMVMGVAQDKIYEGFNAVDVEAIHRSATRVRASTPNRGNGGHRFIYVGQLIERKGVDLLLGAFAASRMTDDLLTIVGDGPLLATLQTKAESLGIADAISFTGAVAPQDVPGILAVHHTLVLPSIEEVWGLVVNEALAAGLQAVVSDASGVARSVGHMNGVQVAAPDVADLGRALVNARATWCGWVVEPEILTKTPAAFAGVFLKALDVESRP